VFGWDSGWVVWLFLGVSPLKFAAKGVVGVAGCGGGVIFECLRGVGLGVFGGGEVVLFVCVVCFFSFRWLCFCGESCFFAMSCPTARRAI